MVGRPWRMGSYRKLPIGIIIITMMMGVLRFINSSYQERRIKKDQTTPHDLKLDSDICSALKHNIDATCKGLHKKGKGAVTQQKTFSPTEFTKLVATLLDMPKDGYTHFTKGYMSLAEQFGGRVSDYIKFRRR